jgi:hypothetical protein
MSKLTLALFLVALAMSLPRASGATNYHEYKKFNLAGPAETIPHRCHASLKEHRNYHYCDKWRDFLHQD